MALTDYQKAFLKRDLIVKEHVIDGDTGVAVDWGNLGGSSITGTSDVPGLDAALAGKQPLDSDLTAIAALSTTSYGRAFLALADAAAARTALALGSLATASAVTTGQLPATYQAGTIQIAVDNGSTVLSTGLAARFVVPFTCTVTSWEILANASGSIQFDIWKDSYANYPPTIADTITGSAKPLISSAAKATSSTLTGWTTLLTAGDVVFINIDSVTTIASAVLALSVTRS